VEVLRTHGIEVRPSWLPFTPWTTLDQLRNLVDFVAEHDLVGNVDPVQYTIRLLVPEGSLLLEREDLREHLGPYEAERLSYPWRSADPAADRLQGRLSALVQQSAAAQEATGLTFARIRAAVREATGEAPTTEPEAIPMGSTEGRPRLTEPWFC
jgi:hypothetical protein